jgi:hypothetical protein
MAKQRRPRMGESSGEAGAVPPEPRRPGRPPDGGAASAAPSRWKCGEAALGRESGGWGGGGGSALDRRPASGDEVVGGVSGTMN